MCDLAVRSVGGRIRARQAPNCCSSIVLENGHPISDPLIALSPACVRSSCARGD